jgi:hypothetical protein
VREKLNSNPIAQIAVIAVLAAAAAFMLLKGGGGEEGEGSTAATSTTASASASGAAPASGETTTAGATTATAATSGEAGGVEASGATEATAALPTSVPAPPLPHAVSAAYKANKIVVLVIVRKGGVDDPYARFSNALFKGAPRRIIPRPVAVFLVPAKRISRYAAITVGVDVQNVPAVVVVRPRNLNRHGAPQASVSYGAQTLLSVVQAVREAVYKGPETTYHPN